MVYQAYPKCALYLRVNYMYMYIYISHTFTALFLQIHHKIVFFALMVLFNVHTCPVFLIYLLITSEYSILGHCKASTNPFM